MKKRLMAFIIAFVMILGLLPVTAKADSTQVTAYVSISNDASYVSAGNTVMAMKEVSVPYFDLANYDLEDFYFNPDCYMYEDYDTSKQLPGDSYTAEGVVTLLHLMIYVAEVYYHGISPENAGTGWLRDQGRLKKINETLSGNESMVISGSAGSIYFEKYLTMNENFNYYINYEYPLAYPGWGVTADQYALNPSVPDIVSIAHFNHWHAYEDPSSVVSYARNASGSFRPMNTSGSDTLTFYHAKADFINFNTTSETAYASVPVYYVKTDSITSGDVTTWNTVPGTMASGCITVDTSTWGSGTYLVAIAGQPGSQYTTNICCAPGGILITK